jgi:hypothetical protein
LDHLDKQYRQWGELPSEIHGNVLRRLVVACHTFVAVRARPVAAAVGRRAGFPDATAFIRFFAPANRMTRRPACDAGRRDLMARLRHGIA